MRHRAVRIAINFLIPAVLAVSVFGIGTPQTAAPQRSRREPAGIKALMRHVIPGTRDLPLIVELTDPGVLEMMALQAAPGTATVATLGQGRSRAMLNAPEALSYRTQLKRTRDLMTTKLGALNGVQVEASTELVINSLFVRAPVEQYDAIRRMPGVKKVYFSRLQHMELNAAKNVVNAPGLWTAAGGQANAGKGVNIGIIDTGIDYTHPMFADTTTPLPAGFPKYDTTADLRLTNHKVIVARDFVQTQYGYSAQTINDARDEMGHGTFNAGVSAGKLVTAPDANVGLISGMAPGAFLGNYKIFGTPGINDNATTEGIIAAIEQGVSDGMDVLSLSLGGLDWLPPSEDPEVTAISNATAAGVVVVVAAGNEGDDPHTVTSPGGSPDAITVGAVWNSRALGPGLHVTSPISTPSNPQYISYVNGSGPTISSAIPATPVVDVASLDGTGLACAALPSGGLNGEIALVARGQCTFSTKVTDASSAGARAVIVYDNVPGDQLFTMGGLTSSGPPAVMISYSDALNLKTFFAANSGTTVSIDVSTIEQSVPTTPAILAAFSSRGPSADFGIKPDLSAVGIDVYSATQNTYSNGGMYSSTRYYYGDGTSFSTPMVTGAVAGIIQLFPSLTAAQVKSAIVNTASQTVTIDGTTPATVTQTGAGLLNMGNAASAGAIFSPVSLNFGVQSYSGSITTTLPLTITNTLASTDQYAVSLLPLVAGPSVSLSTTNTGPVPSNQSVTINVTIQAAAPLTGGFQGYISVQSAQTSTTYSVPYWAGIYVPDSSRVLKVSQGATGQNIFSNLKDALAAANPGNVIEFADSQTYTLTSSLDPTSVPSIMISTNAQGLPLHGITIRAAAGQNPILDGSAASAYADLQVVGAQGVLIQGLTINGGDTGIDIWQPSASVPTSVTIDRCTLTNQTTSSSSIGVYVENGGDVSITNSTILNPEYAGVYAQGGARVTMSGSMVQGSQNYGIGAFDSNMDVINSTATANLYAGASLDNCSGTLTKSTFSYNTDPSLGDGLDLFDGAMTITGNTFIGNASAGIYLDYDTGSGPTGRIERNTFQSNAEYGIQSAQAQNMQIIANFIADGGVGVETYGYTTATLINNIIVRSVYPSNFPAGYSDWGNGVYVDGNSTISLVNDTIYKNQYHGIVRYGRAPSVTVQNTIISQNPSGDQSGLASGNVIYSFIGDGSITGSSNRRGNPNFNNPSGNDFSLAAGSAAIDAGNNAAPNLPFLDYNQQFRVASAGQLPGAGIVDMGAIEYGSSYPIVYPLLASGAVNGTGTGLDNSSFITAFVAVNPPPNSSATQATFTAYDSSGYPFSGQTATNSVSIDPEAHYAGLDFQLFNYAFGASKLGAVLASSIQKLVGFFLVLDPAFQHLADGVDVSADTYTSFYFMRHESDASGQATYQIFNPGVNPAAITAQAYDSSGNVLGGVYFTIPAKGQYSFAFNSMASSSGYVHVTSTQPVSGVEIFGNSNEIAALRAAPAGTEARLFFPHFAVNQGWSSLIGILNTSALTANLTLTAYGNDGSILGTPALRQVNANGQLLESASSLFGLSSGGTLAGYIIVTSDQPGITGFSEFNFTNGGVNSVTAVPSQSVPQPMLIFSHIANQWPSGTPNDPYLTGIALLNPYGTQVAYLMKVFDGSGNVVAEMTDTLGPYQKVSKYLSWPTPGVGFFTTSDPSFQLGGGHIEVTALDPTTMTPGYQLLGFELFFTSSFSQLAAVMAQFPN